MQNINRIRAKNVCPSCPPGGSKNILLGFLANIRYIRDGICTGYIRWIYPQVKKDTKYLIKKSINQSACMNAEIESGRGEKVCVPPTDI